jgi:L-alanine-DL-glutamate epimerase-like enolase superfamily enzyme
MTELMRKSGVARRNDHSIRSIESIPVSIPLARPIKWARGQINDIEHVIVVVTLSNGVQGIADAPPRPTIYGETQQSIVAVISQHFAPGLTGVNAFEMAQVSAVLNAMPANATARAAVDMAVYDAQAKTLGISCAELLGGTVKNLPINWRIRAATKKETLSEADDMMKRYGFRAFKVKCGMDASRDVDVLRALRKHVGKDVEIAVDMNQGYTPRQLMEASPAFEELNIALIEEPIPARDREGKLLAARATHVSISGDDSCFFLDDVRDELQLGAIGALVIKCARSGYTMSRDMLGLARAFHCPVHNGSNADMHIGSASSAHFACTYTSSHAHEMSYFLDAADQVGDQELVIRNGELILPPGPGIGINLDPKKLKKYRTDQ